MAELDFHRRIDALDTSLFEIDAQLAQDDKRSLLALQSACRQAYGQYAYLEIGSHLGGSLQTHVRDPACISVTSIDPRPAHQPDERGISFDYVDNSTERMLENLRALPEADLEKVKTIENSSEELDPTLVSPAPQLAFVDGEHTDRATALDAQYCLAAMRGNGCIAFHDAQIVHRALKTLVEAWEAAGVLVSAAALPDHVFVVEVGESRLLQTEPLASVAARGYLAYFRALADFDQYRVDYIRPSRTFLRRLERYARAAWRN